MLISKRANTLHCDFRNFCTLPWPSTRRYSGSNTKCLQWQAKHGISFLQQATSSLEVRLSFVKMVLDQYTYVFAIGTFFALLEAYNNGASKFSATLLESL